MRAKRADASRRRRAGQAERRHQVLQGRKRSGVGCCRASGCGDVVVYEHQQMFSGSLGRLSTLRRRPQGARATMRGRLDRLPPLSALGAGEAAAAFTNDTIKS